MNSESFPENKHSAQQPINPIGPRLKRAREELRLTITDIARQLRLTEKRIEALENDDYQNMPGITFIKGYLRAYAKLVHLPADELILDFERLNLIPETKPFILSSYSQPGLLNNKSLRWVLYLIAIGLLILVATWWSSTNPDPANLNSSETKHASTKNTPVTGALTNSTIPAMSSENMAGNSDHVAAASLPAKNPVQRREATNATSRTTINATDMPHSEQEIEQAFPSSESSPASSEPASTPSVSNKSSNKPIATAGVADTMIDEDNNNAQSQPRKKPTALSHSRLQLDEPFNDE